MKKGGPSMLLFCYYDNIVLREPNSVVLFSEILPTLSPFSSVLKEGTTPPPARRLKATLHMEI